MIITQYPYIDDNGVSHNDKVKFYSDENLQIKQEETDRVFDNVIDTYPSSYTYTETDVLIDYLLNI